MDKTFEVIRFIARSASSRRYQLVKGGPRPANLWRERATLTKKKPPFLEALQELCVRNLRLKPGAVRSEFEAR
jgi:hypothetical protein